MEGTVAAAVMLGLWMVGVTLVEGWFRREWNWAVDRTEAMAAGARFILPVCIDNTPEKGALVPEVFLRAHWLRLPGGEITPDIAGRLQELIGARR